MKPGFDAGSWRQAQVLGSSEMAPWNVGTQFTAMIQGRAVYGTVRSALVPSDPLASALGRPNREQVTSLRPQAATTLQLLELTNGGTLAQLLHQGAEKLAAGTSPGREVVDRVFRQGLGRPPTPVEADLALALLGTPLQIQGVEDLVWSVAMLPEFQLVY